MQCVHRQRQMVRSIPLVEFRALGFAWHLCSNHEIGLVCFNVRSLLCGLRYRWKPEQASLSEGRVMIQTSDRRTKTIPSIGTFQTSERSRKTPAAYKAR